MLHAYLSYRCQYKAGLTCLTGCGDSQMNCTLSQRQCCSCISYLVLVSSIHTHTTYPLYTQHHIPTVRTTPHTQYLYTQYVYVPHTQHTHHIPNCLTFSGGSFSEQFYSLTRSPTGLQGNQPLGRRRVILSLLCLVSSFYRSGGEIFLQRLTQMQHVYIIYIILKI